jgi:hypothetical protein
MVPDVGNLRLQVVIHDRDELEAGFVLQCEPKHGIRFFNDELAADIGAMVLDISAFGASQSSQFHHRLPPHNTREG